MYTRNRYRCFGRSRLLFAARIRTGPLEAALLIGDSIAVLELAEIAGSPRGTTRFGSKMTSVGWTVRLKRPDRADTNLVSRAFSSTGVTLIIAYISIYGMVKTIRVSEEYHEWLDAHKEDDETMEEALRRMTRGPHPGDVAGLLTEAEAEEAKEAAEELRSGDRSRFEAAEDAFGEESDR